MHPRVRQGLVVALFAAVLIVTGFIRLSGYEPSVLTPLTRYTTIIYVGATVAAALTLQNLGVDFKRLGFGVRFQWWHLGAALVAVVILQTWNRVGFPIMAEALASFGLSGPGYVAQRFSNVEGSATALLSMLLLSWTSAAFGEELSFRIVLMRGMASALGSSRVAAIAALVISAIIFGMIHVYKGPAGVVSSTLSGLVFGFLVIRARGAIWPAALAHGINNSIAIVGMYTG